MIDEHRGFNECTFATYCLGLLLGTFLLFLESNVYAQSNESVDYSTADIVKNVRFSGNETIKTTVLENLVRTRTNRTFFGIPNFTPWHWFWQAFKTIGEPPYVLDRSLIGDDIERIEAFYESRGFLDAVVDTTVIEFNPRQFEVSFLINEGTPSVIKTVRFSGFPETLLSYPAKKFYSESSLARKPLSDTSFTSNTPFSYQKVNAERDRILTFLKRRGFASVLRDSVRFFIVREDSLPTNLDVWVTIRPGQIYTFGDVQISLSGTDLENNSIQKDSSFVVSNQDTSKIVLTKDADAQTDFSLLYTQLKIVPGTIYNEQLYNQTLNNFQNLGMLSIRRFGLGANGRLADFSKPELPVFLDMQTLAKHSINFNVFGFQRFGLGAGAGLTYLNKNLFGEAEQLEIGIKGSFEYATFDNDQRLLLSREATIGYAVPGLSFPFSGLNRNPYITRSRTVYQLRATQVNQINFDVNANLGFNLSYEATHSSTLSSTLDLFEIEWIDAQATQRLIDDLNSNPNLLPLQIALILEDFRPQINSQTRYTLRNIKTDIIRRNYGYFLETSFETGGTLPFLADNYVFTPSTVTGTIPSFGQTELTYSRFVKASVDFRKYISLSDRSVAAYRLFGGFALPYGEIKTIPLTRRFFAGGSNDIRGWAPGTLGPGPFQDSNLEATNGGEIKLAAFTEIRQQIIENFLSSNWEVALFADAGNIWNGPNNPINEGKFDARTFYKEIAVASGIGLRLDWEYVIFRIDTAFRLHEPDASNWFSNQKLYWFFGIGHSF